MIKRSLTGNILSFISSSDINIDRVVEASVKEGLQSLYAKPEEVLEKYKDFDIVKAMLDRQDQKFLWVRARAIDADTINSNGDYFSKEELLKETDYKNKKVPAYKTFEGVPVYTNHKNNDIEEAKGIVIYSEWDEKDNCVYVTFVIDEEAYPHIARGVRQGYMTDVSMGCSVEGGFCSVCNNDAKTEKEYCEHMSKYKGKTYPETGKKAYEKNYGIKFIELSVVGDGAFDRCEIEEIYDPQEIIKKALDIQDKVSDIKNKNENENVSTSKEVENLMRSVEAISKNITKIAQSAGTLVGGNILADKGAAQNTTVANILKFLGLDPQSGLNILDMLNLALNFLEVTIMNLFARKDNIDLAHVGKIAKSMADLQATMQDMIEDGIDFGNTQSGNMPLNQQSVNQPLQGYAPSVPQPQLTTPQGEINQSGEAYTIPEGDVGKMVEPVPQTAQNVFSLNKNTDSDFPYVTWASKHNKRGRKKIFAGITSQQNNRMVNDHLLKLQNSLVKIASDLGIDFNDKNFQKTPLKEKTIIGGTKMDVFERFVANRRVATVSQDFNVEDIDGNRITLSSDGSIKSFHNGTQINWDPVLTEDQLTALENGKGTEIAYSMLQNFKQAMAVKEVDILETTREEALEGARKHDVGTDVIEDRLKNKAQEYSQKNQSKLDTREKALGVERTGVPDNKPKEILLDDAGLYSRKGSENEIKEVLLEDARRSFDNRVIEEKLEQFRHQASSDAPDEVVRLAVDSLAESVITSASSPEEILNTTMEVVKNHKSEDMAELVILAHLGLGHREKVVASVSSGNVVMSTRNAIFHNLGKAISDKISAKDIADAVSVIAENYSYALKNITESARNKISVNNKYSSKNSSIDRMRAALKAVSYDEDGADITFNKDHVKGVISAIASSTMETDSDVKRVLASIEKYDLNDFIKEIEIARSAESSNTRVNRRNSDRFWGIQRVASSEIEEMQNVIGWLADYADAYEFEDSASMAYAAKKIAKVPVVAEKLVNKMIFGNANVTEETNKTISVNCKLSDIGLSSQDVQSPDFEDRVKSGLADAMGRKGYQITANDFTSVDVSSDNYVQARIDKKFVLTAPPDDETNLGEESPPYITTEVEAPEAQIVGEDYEAGRSPLLAQAMPMGAGGAPVQQMPPMVAPGMGSNMGAMTSPMNDPLAAGGPGGISSLTGGNPDQPINPLDATNGGEEAPESNSMEAGEPNKAERKPWGTVCPQCGSMDVNIAEGKGECQNCGANLTYKFIVEVNDPDYNAEEKAIEDAPEGGLGAETAPQEELQPQPTGLTGGGLMAQASWETDSDVFIRLASEGYNKNKEKKLPVGMICPSCGNRNANKTKDTTYCLRCGTISKSKVDKHPESSTKLISTITWLS